MRAAIPPGKDARLYGRQDACRYMVASRAQWHPCRT